MAGKPLRRWRTEESAIAVQSQETNGGRKLDTWYKIHGKQIGEIHNDVRMLEKVRKLVVDRAERRGG